MAETKRQKNKLHSTITEHLLPEIGVAGDVYFARAEGTVWLATKSGLVVSLSDVLNSVPAHTPPRAGRDGKDGVSIKGDKGDAGRDGKDGINGRDGVGYAGAVGPQGRAGKDCVCKTTDVEHSIAGVAKNLSDSRDEVAALKQQITTLSATVQGLIDMNKQSSEYIEWLRERVARRAKQ